MKKKLEREEEGRMEIRTTENWKEDGAMGPREQRTEDWKERKMKDRKKFA